MNRAAPSGSAKRIAVIGYGTQGRGQALRLRAAGADVVVGLRPQSRLRGRARSDDLPVTTPARAVQQCDTVVMLVPDQAGAAVFDRLRPTMSDGTLVVFAAGFPLVWGRPEPAGPFDIVLVAPHGPGGDLEKGLPMSGFVGVHRDQSGRALSRAGSYARLVGIDPLFETSARDEALGDVFGEQALLCGGLMGLTSAVARQMLKRGIPPANVYYETTAQLERLSRLLASEGVHGFWNAISDCAAAGSARATKRLFGRAFHPSLLGVWDEIESGRFARTLHARGRPAAIPRDWLVLDQIARAAESGGRTKRRASKRSGRKKGGAATGKSR